MPSYCRGENCKGTKTGKRKRALFGKPGGTPFVCWTCGQQLPFKVVNLSKNKSKRICDRCLHQDCNKRRAFGYRGGKALYCKEHSFEGMINLEAKTCLHQDCQKIRTFGYEGGEPQYCKEHSFEGMINLKTKKCFHPDCQKIRTFGYEGGEPQYCKEHSVEGMINLDCMTCLHPDCNKRRTFGYKGGEPEYCKEHSFEGMINLKTKKCFHPDCQKIRAFDYEGGEPQYCKEHSVEGMINLKRASCRSDFCDASVEYKHKYDGYCANCFSYFFPKDPRVHSIRVKTKEMLVRDFINQHFDGFLHDIPISWGGCDCSSRRRIDHRKLVNGTMLAIETDEHQHIHYNQNDEEVRYNDLFMLHSGNWIFIRFNPDKYKDETGRNHKGMVKANGHRNNAEIDRRLQALKKEIEKQIDRVERYENTELVEIHKLFFDENFVMTV